VLSGLGYSMSKLVAVVAVDEPSRFFNRLTTTALTQLGAFYQDTIATRFHWFVPVAM
jgi:hypothetical protein